MIPYAELPKKKSSVSGTSSSKYVPKHAGESQTISDILSTIYNDTSDNNYIDVSVSATLQASIRTRNNVKAFLDTSSLAGDFVAFRTLQALNLEPYILTDKSKLVCSGLDNSCYDLSNYIALQVSYFSENLNKYASIELKATILNSSPCRPIRTHTVRSGLFPYIVLLRFRFTSYVTLCFRTTSTLTSLVVLQLRRSRCSREIVVTYHIH
jgi:hypothetical protein